MGERPGLGSPTSIASKAPSISTGRVGENFSPVTPRFSGSRTERSATFNFTKPKSGEVARSTGRFGPLERKARTSPTFARAVEQIPQLPFARTRVNSIPNPDDRYFARSSVAGARREGTVVDVLARAQKKALEARVNHSPVPRLQGVSLEAHPNLTQGIERARFEKEAQKPAVLGRDRLQKVRDMATQTAERLKKKVLSINLENPMTLLEMTEAARAVIKIANGGGLGEIPALLASAALIRGIETFPLILTDQTKSILPNEAGSAVDINNGSFTVGDVIGFTEKVMEHEFERKAAEAILDKTLDGAREIAKTIREKQALDPETNHQTEAIYQRIKVHPETQRVIAAAHVLVKKGLTQEQVQAQIIEETANNELGLVPQELVVVTQIATRRWIEAKTKVGEEENDEEKKEKDEIDPDNLVAEKDPLAQAERMTALKDALDSAEEDEEGWVESENIASRLPYQVDNPKIISEARYWYYIFHNYDPEPDGSWPQSLKEMASSGKHQSKATAWKSFSLILENNIPIRWRKKSEQTQQEATKKQKDLVYARIADDVAREAASVLVA